MEQIRKELATDFGMETGGGELKMELGELTDGMQRYQAGGGNPGTLGTGHVCVEGMTLQKNYAIQVGAKLVQKREVLGLYLLGGMSRVHAAKVMAHELTHVYLAQHKFFNLPLEVEEGLCEIVSYLWLANQITQVQDHTSAVPRLATASAGPGDSIAPLRTLQIISTDADLRGGLSLLRRMEADVRDVYGTGFRQAHGALQGRTLPELFEYVREHKEFPPPRVTGNHGQQVQFLVAGSASGSSVRAIPAVQAEPNISGDNSLERIIGGIR